MKRSVHIITIYILVPSQKYQDSRYLLQNPTGPNYVMSFSNCAQAFTGSKGPGT